MRFDPHLLKKNKQLISHYYHGLKTPKNKKRKKKEKKNTKLPLFIKKKKRKKKKNRMPLFSKKNIGLLLLKTQSDIMLYST